MISIYLDIGFQYYFVYIFNRANPPPCGRSKGIDAVINPIITRIHIFNRDLSTEKEWEEFDNKLQNKLLIERDLKWFIEELKALKEFDPATESIEFRSDIFSRIIKSGVMFNGSITYELNIGVTRIAKHKCYGHLEY